MNSIVVACPGCSMRYQFPPGVPQMACSNCGTVCRAPRIDPQPDARQPNHRPSGPAQAAAAGSAGQNSRSKALPVILGTCGVSIAAFLVTGLVLLVRGQSNLRSVEEQRAVEADEQALADQIRREAMVFREVDLPESRRQELYRELTIARSTTVDAKIPGGDRTKIGQFVQGNLGSVFDRELELQALANNVSKEDLGEILKEGDKKGW